MGTKDTLLLMDKNKSAFKLENIPHVYWLNLDNDVERREYMETQFEYWNIKNHTRISGYDARIDDVSSNLKGRIPDNVSQSELGCCLSHLKAIKHFYENSNDDYCMIVEDDVNFSIAKYWNFSWRDFFCHIPYDWDCVQLTTICTGNIHVKLHLRFVNDFSAAVYLITRHHASKIIKNHIRGNKYRLDNGVKPRAVSEDVVFESGKTYSIPIFLYNLELGSTIHPEHIEVFHRQPHDGLLNFWKQMGPELQIKDYMDYDPWNGRISQPSQKSKEEA
ncbi:glycosyltransferase family 25 protein [archaeon]|nr:glycosyltransferase family 25 protein [archaeon]